MADKLGRKEMPTGYNAASFIYKGRPSKDQGDFGTEVGVADCGCVNQLGQCNNSKYYHGGVVQSADGIWWVYLEWGRIFSGASWNGSFKGQDFQFVKCSSESDARSFFAKQLGSKNTKRMVKKNIGGKEIWCSKEGDDAYFVMKLATREKGLPDALTIKDNTGVVATPVAVPVAAKKASKPVVPKTFQTQVIRLAESLVGGVKTYTRFLTKASGVTPTMDAILEVRDTYVPLALGRIKVVGDDIDSQIKDKGLRDLSRLVSSMIPRPIPRTGISDREAILSSENIARLEQDLDTFEAALKGEDFSKAADQAVTTTDPDSLLNAKLTWLDSSDKLGKAVISMLQAQTNGRHGYLSGNLKVLNLFQVERPDRDVQFLDNVKKVAVKRQGRFGVKAGLQPKVRVDLTPEEIELYGQANVIVTQHGTRSVNISPIIQSHFRMPKSLPGALICGANFGHGTYHSTDFRKAVGYTSYTGSAWSNGQGGVQGRGAFMFLNDMLMGDSYLAPSTGSWNQPPDGKDSVFGRGGDRGHALQNDEHVIFQPHYTRIRYLVEFTF